MPASIIKQAAKTSEAPITGVGMITNTAASFGTNAMRISNPPIAQAIRRLVAPVASDRPTLLDDTDWPRPPYLPSRMPTEKRDH